MTIFEQQRFTVPKVDTDNLTKLYYSIGEVADMFDVNASLIRFWEKEFPQLKPKKNNKGNRLFTVKDVEKLNKIYFLVKEKGFTLDGAKNQMKRGAEIIVEETSIESEPSIDHDKVLSRLETVKQKLLRLRSNSN